MQQMILWEESQEQMPVTSTTGRKSHKRQAITDSVESSILKGYALMLWFYRGGTIPLQRGEITYSVVMSADQKAWASLRDEYEMLELTEQEMGYLQEYAYCHLVESRVQSGGTSSALQFIDQDEEDDPTEGDSRSKPKKKAGVKELETQVAILRMELMLARPKELERSMQSLRRASLRVRDLGYYLEVCEKAMIRLAVRVAELEGHEYVPPTAYPTPNRNCYLCGTSNWEWRGYSYHCITCKAEPTDIEDLRGKLEVTTQENEHLRRRIAELEGRETEA